VRLRPPILFTAAYGAGLATGLLHFGAPLWVVLPLLAIAAFARRPLVLLVCGAALLGRMSGEIAVLRDRRSCAALLSAGAVRLTVKLLEPIEDAGGAVEVQPLSPGCTGRVSARWPRGLPSDAGTIVAAKGRWIPRPNRSGQANGTLVVASGHRASDRFSRSAGLRNSLSHASRTLYGARAPMVDALVLGRRGTLDRALQDRFAQSGLVHLLSISGFHVGVITAWMILVCRLMRLWRNRAPLVTAATSVAYVAFLGWPAPAARAAALAVLLALSRARQRRVETNALLSATCLCVLLLDPRAIVDLGAWLSASALWGATTFSRWTDRVLGSSVWWRTLGSSIGATLATAPITAATLGAVAVIGILLNFVAIPLAALAVPGVLASLLVFPIWPSLAAALAGGAGLTLHLLELLATAGAAVPGGHLLEPAEVSSSLPWLAGLGVGLWICGTHNTLAEAGRRGGWAAVVLLWSTLLWAAAEGSANGSSGLTLHFLDVGQGDGALLQTPGGRWVLVDAGPRTDRSDAGRRVVVPFLARHGARELAVAVVSHAHADHLGGLHSVLQRFRAGLVIEPGDRVADPLYFEFLDQLATESIAWHRGRRGERFTVDSVDFTVLHPYEWPRWGEDLNEDSVVLLVEYGNFQALFPGDVGFPAEEEMRGRLPAVDLLKVGHHGSRGSSGDEWLDSLRPKTAIISVGQNNYGHPAPETLERLLRHGVQIWRTDRDGLVTVQTDGERMTLTAQGRSATFDVRERSLNR
jgi:competence protein ComEC